MTQDDVQAFIRMGLAGICALAYVGWTYHLIKLEMARREREEQF